MKKLFLTLIFFVIIAVISMQFGTQSFVYTDPEVVPEKDQPVHFKLNPVLWLPSYFIFKNDVTDLTIVKSILWVTPYWLLISYLLTRLTLWSLAKKRGNSSPQN